MATKDFKVKNGLSVGEGISVDSGSIIVAGIEVINSSGNVVGVYQGFDSDFSVSISSTTTDSLSEGLNNLYYTQTRFDSAFSAKSTSDLVEGSNLYYTQTRFDSAFDVRLSLKTTSDLTEGSNLYYTQTRFDSDLSTKSTSDLTEGSNLYYTDNRVLSYLSTNNYATVSNIDSAIAALVAAAPSQLDTLNELAAAINNDSNFAGSITALIGEKVAKNEFFTYFDSNFALKSTSDLVEGSNLYYTQGRFDSALSNKTTDNLTEGSNLYYTSSRVDSDILDLVDSSYIENRRPAEAIFNVVNNGTSAYSFTGDGFPTSSDNPVLYLQKGLTYKFKINSPSHPFEIRVSNGGTAYSDGVINNSIGSGDIYFTVPMDAPSTLYYQCTIHSSMVGTIYISEAASITTDNISEGTTNLYYTDNRVTSLIDSAYIQARQIDFYRDSDFVINIIDSAYINSRVVIPPSGIDSTGVINLIDSAYIQARQIVGGGAGTVDSAQTIALITDTVDSSYIQNRVTIPPGGVDSSVVFSLIDSAYIQARQIVSGGSGTVDSAQTISLISTTVDSAYIAARGGIYYLDEFSVSEYKFTADSNQTVFTGTDDNGKTLAFNSSNYQVYVNGVKITTSDYTANSLTDTVTLVDPASFEDEILVTVYNREQGATNVTLVDSDWLTNLVSTVYAGSASVETYFFTADSGQSLFTGIDDNGQTLSYRSGSIQVFVNGVAIVDGIDFTATNGSSITLDIPADSGDQILINDFGALYSTNLGLDSSTIITLIDSAYIQARQIVGGGGAGTVDSAQTISLITNTVDSAYIQARGGIQYITVDHYFENYKFISDSGQTIFSGSDFNGNVLAFDSSEFQIYINGIRITDVDFAANPITDTVTLTTGTLQNDEVVITTLKVKPGSEVSLGIDSAQTIVLITDTIDSAYINDRVDAGGSGTVDSAQMINLITDIVDSDYVRSRVSYWREVSNNYTATAGQRLIVDTSTNSIQISLPAVATLGDEIRIVDGTGNASNNNIVILHNGHKIQGGDSDLTVDVNEAAFGLVYYNTTRGWILTEK